jgi:hypothetical protein
VDNLRYYRKKCGCVEIVDVDSRAVTHVPCSEHDFDEFPLATSCPACEDDGLPCALCNQAFTKDGPA